MKREWRKKITGARDKYHTLCLYYDKSGKIERRGYYILAGRIIFNSRTKAIKPIPEGSFMILIKKAKRYNKKTFDKLAEKINNRIHEYFGEYEKDWRRGYEKDLERAAEFIFNNIKEGD